MNRRLYLLLVLVAIGAGALAIWGIAGEPAESATATADTTQVSQPATAVSQMVGQPESKPAAVTKTTAQWIADTASGNATTRAAAIAALAEAPRSEALPVLGRILNDGEPEVDRLLALQSLRDLAMNQGDADGAIRDAIRHVIYHGDDLTRTEAVQDALDVIEESLQAH
jgi:hypothetical protein